MRLHVGPFADPKLYQRSAEQNLSGLIQLCDLEPTSSVLDVGCGSGRMAAALSRYLTESGTYDGFDAAREPVAWCQRHIEADLPNFRFRCIDTFSQRYSPGGRARDSDLTFPYPNDRFDVVFANSVYTHMLPPSIRRYVQETSRVLRPGGLSFATFCLLNDESLPNVKAGTSSPPLPHEWQGCRVRDTENPSSFVAQAEDLVRSFYDNAGMRIADPISYGSWARSEPKTDVSMRYGFAQDIVIAVKPMHRD